MEDEHAILELLSEPCDILWMCKIIQGARCDYNWKFNRREIIRWRRRFAILGHVLILSIVVSLERWTCLLDQLSVVSVTVNAGS